MVKGTSDNKSEENRPTIKLNKLNSAKDRLKISFLLHGGLENDYGS